MTSSDGFYPFPLWKISETSTQSSASASVVSGNEETGQSQTAAQQVEKRSDWSQGPAVTCSDEQPVMETQLVCPSHACLHLKEVVVCQTQDCQTDPPLGVIGSLSPSPEHNSQPVNSDYNPLELQDGIASEWVPRTHNADEMFSQEDPVMAGGLSPHLFLGYRQLTESSETLVGHGSMVEHGESVLLLSEASTDGEPAKPMPNEVTAVDSVEKSSQDLLSNSGYVAHNVCLQLTEVVVCHTPDPHTASALNVPESLSPFQEHNYGLVSSSEPNAPVELQDVLASPRAYSGDEMLSLDPVGAAVLSPPPVASTNLAESSGRLVGPSDVFEHEQSVLLLSEANTNGEAVKLVPNEVTAVGSVEESCLEPLSSSATAVVCHTQDSHTASAIGVCGALSPSPEHNSGPVSSDELVELKGGITSEEVHRTRIADMNLSLDPLTAGRLSPQPFLGSGDLRETSETLAGHGSMVEPEESVLLVGEAGTDREAIRPVPNELTAVDSVEEYCNDYLSTSAGAVNNVCQRECVGSFFPRFLGEEYKQQHALSYTANSNGACPDSEPLTKCVIQKDSLVAAETTDISAKEKQTRCSETLQENPENSQTSADSESPYSFRRKRRYPPSRSSSSVDRNSAPVGAEQSCPVLEQTCRPSSPPVEGCSQAAPAPLTVPAKKKRGRPRKMQQPASQNEVSSTGVVPAGKATLGSPIACESTLTEDCLEESPDSSLFTGGYHKRKAAAAAASSTSSKAGGETEGQGSSSSLPVPPLVLSSDALLQESERPAASCLDLSLEQILQDDPMPLTPLSLPEEEEEDEDPEDDEELPSILERKPLSITEGLCVWCKFRKYPFWPAVVKSVNHKNKKASIVFIDTFLIDEKGIRKGLTVSLKTLKPFDCEEAEEMTEQARQQYGDAITWCLELIYDYRIRIGCGSFSGSFIEYFANDISCPLRQMYSQGPSDLTFPTQLIVDDLCDTSEEDGAGDQADEHQCKKMLPDRAKAARTRANEKLVDFIVRKRGAEKRLLAVISGQETSKWLRALQKASRFVVDPYLEDEEQVDQVYRYLDELLRRSPQTLPCLAHLERIPLILDVLLPEALIHAIAGVDDIPLEEAEDKYRKGPCISKRERQEFNMRIEQLMKTLNQCKHVL
ncbi:uncharacterized protein LOC143133806 isoform X1 [Alosa pseudoharengus]|uniref:uncharacterized protein LOC143133806 isoform X1 n=1 Tax=Alosa pseudoharengus TaxID=34774 RepID=UPI003F8BC0D1